MYYTIIDCQIITDVILEFIEWQQQINDNQLGTVYGDDLVQLYYNTSSMPVNCKYVLVALASSTNAFIDGQVNQVGFSHHTRISHAGNINANAQSPCYTNQLNAIFLVSFTVYGTLVCHLISNALVSGRVGRLEVLPIEVLYKLAIHVTSAFENVLTR